MKRIFLLAVLAFFTLTSFAQFSGSGSGTQSDPYKIFYADQFNELRNCLNQEGVYFQLMNNLDISSWLSDNYPTQGWQPVGSTSEPFKGILDGNGKTISGFSITRTSTDYVGLFGVVEGATIKNLTLKGDIKGKAYVGSLFGSGSATVTNYTFEGTITGTGNYVGGVGGSQSTTSSIINVNATVNGASYTGGIYGKGAGLTSATFTGQVTGTSYTGGLEGEGSGTFTSCTVSAPVTGGECTGGFLGTLLGNTTFNNSAQQGNVTGASYTGGMVGRTDYTLTASNCKHEGNVEGWCATGGLVGRAASDITMNNCTQRGNVTELSTAAYKWNTGGIIGFLETGAITLTSCYVEGNITGSQNVGGICGAMTNPKSSNISSCSYWGNISGASQLGGVVGIVKTTNTNSIDFNATTTAGYKKSTTSNSDPYSHTDCFYKQTASQHVFSPHNSFFYIKTFYATDDISDCIYIDDSEISDWGKSSGSVYTLSSPSHDNNNWVRSTTTQAIKVVYNNIKTTKTNLNVNITNCSVVGNINGTSAYVGGIIGRDIDGNNVAYSLSGSKTVYYYKGQGTNESTTSLTLKKYSYTYTTTNISESYFSGNLTGTNYIGGIAGTKQNGYINKCYASGSIAGGKYVGGIAGSLSKESDNTNENSLNANASICSSITGTSNVGTIYGATDGNFSIAALNTNSENRYVANMQLMIGGIAQEIIDEQQNASEVGISVLRKRASYFAWDWSVNDYWKIIDTETFPYKTWQAAPPTITSSLVSGDTNISGNSTDGGTVYIKIGDGNVQSVTCSGTTFTLTGIEPLKSGSMVQLYTKTNDKEASYINQYTVGYPGSGTEADPWRVYSAEDLQGVYKAGYYKQMNDIDLASWISANSATTGWVPVGYGGSGTIVYDGDNHKITGLWTNTTGSYTGLFSSISSGTIKNLTLQLNAKQVKGGDYTGALIGRINEGSIENVTATGNVSASSFVGGIAGYTTNCSLKQLSYSGQVTASGPAGGITAYASNQPVTSCEVTGSTIKSTGGNVGGLVVSASGIISQCKVTETTISQTGLGSAVVFDAAGLVCETRGGSISKCVTDVILTNASSDGYSAGLVADNKSNITQCCTAGSVTTTGMGAESYTGGLVAKNNSGIRIEDSYSTANVSGTQYTAGLVAYNYGTVNRCYASGDVNSTYYGAGLVGYNEGASAVVTNCVALGSKVEVSDQTGWGIRVIGGYKNGAPDPDESNYAWSGMQISVNGVPKQIQDNILDGQSLSDSEIKLRNSYDALYWDFDNVWAMPANGYPVLKWQLESSEPEVAKGDLSGDGKVSITDVVMIIDVIAGTITDANKVAAADVNGDGNVTITDCVAAIDLIAAQASTPSSARRKANAMLSNTDFISGAMENNLLTISLDNEHRYTAFQMIVSMPEGMTLGRATMDEMRGADHLLTVRDLGGGRYLVAGFSPDNEELVAGSGRLLSIITEGQTAEDIVISDIEFATTQAEAYYLADVTVGGTPTGINEMKNEELRMKNEIYDLQGRRVTKATKGIYMYNGKKTIIK